MEYWFLLALGAALLISITHVFDKILTNYVNPQLLPAIKKALNGGILLTVSILFFHVYFPLTLHFWVFIGILIFFDILSTLFYFTGIKKGEISKLICFNDSTLVILTFLMGVIFLSEKVSIYNGLGVLLISIGSYTVLSNGKIVIPKSSMALKLIFLSSTFWAFYNITVKVAVASFPPYLLAMIVYFAGDPILWGYNFKENRSDIKNIKNTFTHRIIIYLLVACIGASLASLLIFFSLSMGPASLVLPVVYSSPLFTVILSGEILKEENILIRILGAILIVAGISLVYIF